jgi:2-polyprenyl-6-methoxyphenol hydroxylase-like FAD-dependent oxidoreductase
VYSRNVWFDFYPKPYSVARDFLHSLGIKYQNIEYESVNINVASSEGEVILIRCQILERFLSKIVWLFGVNIRYGYEYLEHGNEVVAKNIHTGEVSYFPYNVLVGADGSNSGVRIKSNIASEVVTNFNIVTKDERYRDKKLPNLH